MWTNKNSSSLFSWLRKYALLFVLIVLLIAFFHFRLYQFFTIGMLRTHQAMIVAWTTDHYLLAVLIYIALFALLIACTVPCATVFTLAGGFLFGNIAVLYALLSMALGGTVLFYSVRMSIGPQLAMRSTGWLKSFEDGFKRNAFYYLLTLRLIPVFPCWISNIGAGLMNVSWPTFIAATLLGIFPSTLVYVLAGRGLDKIFDHQNLPLSSIILDPMVLFPLLGLAILSLLPVAYQYFLKKPKQNS